MKMNTGTRSGRIARRVALAATLLATLALSGCNANVGVGMNVAVPVGNNGQMSFSTGRWL
jgi:predicted small secreted protein